MLVNRIGHIFRHSAPALFWMNHCFAFLPIKQACYIHIFPIFQKTCNLVRNRPKNMTNKATPKERFTAMPTISKQKRIERQLEQDLLEGRWKLHERLPAERKLAEIFKVNRNTVRSAICALAGRGLLETVHGSGTSVRALPAEHTDSFTLLERVSASLLLAPAIIHASSLVIRPSQILRLERLLPVAGAALRNNDIKGFAQAQASFFVEAARFINNESINAALAAFLPATRPVVRLLASCGLQENESLFAHLARILSAMRHADAGEASSAARAYFTFLQKLAEDKCDPAGK